MTVYQCPRQLFDEFSSRVEQARKAARVFALRPYENGELVATVKLVRTKNAEAVALQFKALSQQLVPAEHPSGAVDQGDACTSTGKLTAATCGYFFLTRKQAIDCRKNIGSYWYRFPKNNVVISDHPDAIQQITPILPQVLFHLPGFVCRSYEEDHSAFPAFRRQIATVAGPGSSRNGEGSDITQSTPCSV